MIALSPLGLGRRRQCVRPSRYDLQCPIGLEDKTGGRLSVSVSGGPIGREDSRMECLSVFLCPSFRQPVVV